MKKLISIPLFCCFFFNVVGYHIVFYFQRAEIRNEMKKLIHRGAHESVHLVFSVNDANLPRGVSSGDETEFSFNGQMYDIIQKEIRSGQLILHCVADKKETTLLNKLIGGWNENANSNKPAVQLLQFLQTLFHNINAERTPVDELYPRNFRCLADALKSHITDIPTPPPQT